MNIRDNTPVTQVQEVEIGSIWKMLSRALDTGHST